MEQQTFFPAEWHPQSGIQLTWPDAETDWQPILDEVLPVYRQIADEILEREILLLVCRNKSVLPPNFPFAHPNLRLFEMELNDTWARDHGALTLIDHGKPILLNFRFNGWGMKFAANHDNQISPVLFQKKAFAESVPMSNFSYFTLEGGGIESNGKGCILTTSECLLSPNRNEHLSRNEISFFLEKIFHAQKTLWLDHGFLEGDDTDSHIDTLARFCNENTIAYVQCKNPGDPHFEALMKMEEQLKTFCNIDGAPFNLVPLPFPDAIVDEDGQRLPATYANFLILNGAVLVPTYRDRHDNEALAVFAKLFPRHKIIGIDSVPLIKQHGSIHCITMQFPEGVIA